MMIDKEQKQETRHDALIKVGTESKADIYR